MKKIINPGFRVASLMMLVLITISAFGKIEPTKSNKRNLGGMSTGDSLITSVIPVNNDSQHIHHIWNRITLAVCSDTNLCYTDTFTFTARFKVLYWDKTSLQVDSIDTITLAVSWDPRTGKTYTEKNTYLLENAYKVTVVPFYYSSSTLKPRICLYNEMDVERRWNPLHFTGVYPVFSAAPAFKDSSGAYMLIWDELDWVEEYDLEWTWVDDYKSDGAYKTASQVTYNFRNNSGRVTVKTNTYLITPVFSHGYVIFRVRGVGYAGDDFKQRVVSSWSLANAQTVQNVLTYNVKHVLTIGSSVDHEKKKNWQYSVSYAEEGKKKEVVGYFDGSLRNRQNVTKANSTNIAIVAETIYDHQGRAAVSILPVPSLSPRVGYYSSFNINELNKPYSKLEFDTDVVVCGTAGQPLKTDSGASRYYSANNPLKTQLYNQFIPDAQKYPLTRTEYMPDNTGRIRRQSGVGLAHQLDSAHETRYFYGTPEQEELDRLFGTNVGYMEHYRKNMVQDANGQVSISYLDLKGHTIATSLAGNPPTNTTPLVSNDSASLRVNLLGNRDSLVITGDVLETRKTILVSDDNSVYHIAYAIDNDIFNTCLPDGICFDCIYDLEISLKDNCGNELIPGGKLVRTVGAVLLNPDTIQFDTLCSSAANGYNFKSDAAFSAVRSTLNDTAITITLAKGEYHIIKTLRVNSQAVDYYAEQFLRQNTCIYPLDTFLNREYRLIDTMSCFTDCAKCKAQLGTQSSFLSNMVTAMIADSLTPGHTDTLAFDSIYYEKLNECEIVYCQSYPDRCEASYRMMLADMSPGGQYGKYLRAFIAPYEFYPPIDSIVIVRSYGTPVTYEVYHNIHPLSMAAFTLDDKILTGLCYDSIYVDTFYMAVTDLNKKQILDNWDPAWARKLVKLHPEYCLYQQCLNERLSDAYDDRMLNTDSYTAARDSGYLNPLNMIDPADVDTFRYPVRNQDPWFADGGVGNSYRTAMRLQMKNYRGWGLSMWQLNKYMDCIASMDSISFRNCMINYENGTNDSCKRNADNEWSFFRTLYLERKGGYMDVKHQVACNSAFDRLDTLTLYGKERRFFRHEDILQKTGASDPADRNMSHYRDSANYVKSDACFKQCKGYMGYWMEQLGGCRFARPQDSAKFATYLFGVCFLGCDGNNPLGASTVSPRHENYLTLTINGSSSSVNSFEDVFNFYVEKDSILNDLSSGDSLCHCTIDAIAFPRKYNHDYFLNPDGLLNHNLSDTLPIDSTLSNYSRCTCDKLKQLRAEWDANSATRDCFGDSFNVFVSHHIGYYLDPTQVDVLTDACTYLPAGGGIGDCHAPDFTRYVDHSAPSGAPVIPHQIKKYDATFGDSVWFMVYVTDTVAVPLIPYTLQCTTIELNKGCISCQEAVEEAVLFIDKYNGWPDTAYMLPALYATIMNRNYGYNLSYLDFKEFLQTCDTIYKVLFDVKYKQVAGTQQLPSFAKSIQLPTPMDFPDGIGESSTDVGTCACQKMYDVYLSYIDLKEKGKIPANFTLADAFNASNLLIDFDPDSFTIDDLLDKCKNWKDIDSLVTRTISCEYIPICIMGTDTINPCPDPDPGATLDTLVFCDTSYTFNFCEILQSIKGPERACQVDIGCGELNDTLEQNPSLSVAAAEDYLETKYKTNFTVLKATVPIQRETCEGCFTSVFSVCAGLTPEATNYFNLLNTLAMADTLDSDTLDLNGYYAFKRSSFNRSKNNPTCTGSGNDNKATFQSNTPLNFNNEGEAVSTPAGSYDYVFSIGYDTLNYSCMVVFDTLKVQELDSIESFIQITPATVYADGHQRFRCEVVLLGGDTIVATGYTSCFRVSECCAPSRYLCNKPLVTYVVPDDNCVKALKNTALANAMKAYDSYRDSVRQAFKTAYIKKCINTGKKERFFMYYQLHEYHYTLYYYDQAGNLVQTVPPAGVNAFTTQQQLDSTEWYRKNNPSYTYVPAHTLPTNYNYNSLNQLNWQHTPDADTSQFYYDRLGRLVFSQNKKQKNGSSTEKKYSYTVYDALGRITEVGELRSAYALTHEASRRQTFVDSSLAGVHSEITKTWYDAVKYTVTSGTFEQLHLRGRVAHTTYQDAAGTGYRHAVHYSYDIHGNVASMVRENVTLAPIGHQYKQVDYDYDLVSGKVNMVSYQQGEADQFYHRYDYDADNRITAAYTSTDSVHWDKDARYFYYLHGPLARTEVGQHKVQGVDYAYTLHGWLKGVNSNTLNAQRDMGQDGYVNASNVNRTVARDVFGFTLGYYHQNSTENDYIPINEAGIDPLYRFEAAVSGSAFTGASASLYNGNIRHMVTAISKFMEGGAAPMGYAYQYDQLNRLMNVNAWNNTDMDSNKWESSGSTMAGYHNRFTYDANGNILTQVRRGVASGSIALDSLTYHYTSGTNQLDYVTDAVSAGNYSDDIDNQSSGNYEYDEIGNLIGDAQEEIDSITWTVYGKVKSITRTGGSLKPDLEFEYSPDGQRVAKIIKPKTGSHLWKYTYYVRDAQGNIMATYARNLEAIFDPEETNFADVNASLVGEGGAVAFKTFIQNLHPEITSGGFIDSLRIRYLERYPDETPILYYFDPTDILTGDPAAYSYLFTAFGEGQLVAGLFSTKGVADVYSQMCAYNAIGFIEHGITHISATTYLNGLYSYDPAQLLQMYTDAGGTGTPGAAAQISYITGAWSNNAIASWINGVGCSLNYSVLAALYAPGNSNWTTILTSYPNFKTAVSAQYSQADLIAAMIAYSQSFMWEIIVEFYGFEDVLNYVFTNHTSLAYAVILQHYPELVEAVQEDNPYYTLTEYFEHIKDIYGQTMHDRMVYLFIHLSNQFTDRFAATEWHLYGSSRLGVQRPCCDGEQVVCAGHCAAPDGRELIRVEFEGTWEEYAAAFSDTAFSDTSNTQISIFEMNYQYYSLMRGQKSYEMSNHLGNVLAIVSDKRIMTCANDTVNYFTADLIQATDYSAFGVQLKERTWYADTTAKYRFGFNGKEADNETYGDGNAYDFGARIYDPRLGKFVSIDPLFRTYPSFSGYQYNSNSPIWIQDIDGLGDPLAVMKIRGNKASNTFGMVRTGNEGANTKPHQGFDLYAPPGTATFAVKDATVHSTGYSTSYGNYIILKITDENSTDKYAYYAHLSSIGVQQGETVTEGQEIGKTGQTGNAQGQALSEAHLHFEYRTSPLPGSGLGGRVNPNVVLDTKFTSQNPSGNQTTTGVLKEESDGTKTNMNLNGTTEIIDKPTTSFDSSIEGYAAD